MTPDDMEAVVSEWLALASQVWPRCVPVSEGEIDAIRALLLAYQERGRALDGINQLARDRLAPIPADLVHGSVIGQLLFDILGRAILTGED